VSAGVMNQIRQPNRVRMYILPFPMSQSQTAAITVSFSSTKPAIIRMAYQKAQDIHLLPLSQTISGAPKNRQIVIRAACPSAPTKPMN
jgi:hypothetical protein